VKTRHAWRDTHTWTMNDQGKSSENVHVTWIFTVLNHKINYSYIQCAEKWSGQNQTSRTGNAATVL